jgi:hypothetical protein
VPASASSKDVSTSVPIGGLNRNLQGAKLALIVTILPTARKPEFDFQSASGSSRRFPASIRSSCGIGIICVRSTTAATSIGCINSDDRFAASIAARPLLGIELAA